MSKDSPKQYLPSYIGEGFVQDRVRVLYPVPQDLEQVEKLAQFDHAPSTGRL